MLNKVPYFLASLLWCLALTGPADAEPVVVEPGWSLLRTFAFPGAFSARLNPADNLIYVGRRGTATDGLYRLDRLGFSVQLAGGSNIAAVAVEPDSGHVFVSEDYGGILYRTDFGASGRRTWVAGLHAGDDDPVGMAFAPADYVGDVLLPGDGLVVDRGNSGPDEVWRWSPYVAEGETAAHTDDGTLVDPLDVAINQTRVVIADGGGTAAGLLYELLGDGTLVPLPTAEPLLEPCGIDFDAADGTLLVLDTAGGRVVRVDLDGGAVSNVVTGLSTGYAWAGLDLAADGRLLLVTESGSGLVHLFGRCDPAGDPALDCNANGIADLCEISTGEVDDCNGNGVPDSCDLDSGASEDCNLDGVPDECPICPPVEVVFVMDTSTSMDDEASALCGGMTQIVAQLQAAGVTVLPRLLGICDLPGGAYGCLEDHVSSLLGVAVPGSPPAGMETLGACPGGNEVCQEDWGLATAVVAGLYPWLPPTQSIRLVIPLSDEGTWCGDPVTALDQIAISHAIAVARDNGVLVSPITGSGSASGVLALAEALADSTGGTHFSSSTPSLDIAEAIVAQVLQACAAYTDCNQNGTLDQCDIAAGASLDLNENGVPDECENLTGVGSSDLPAGRARLEQNYPNPFNPFTLIRYELSGAQAVTLAIFSLDGRLVRTLVAEVVPAGVHEAVWNGRDDAGRLVGSGTYFYRLEAGAVLETRRMTVLK